MNAKKIIFLPNVKRRRHYKCVCKRLKLLQKKYKRQQVKLPTKLGIVYKTNRGFVVRSYFDSRKRNFIWGIAVGNVFVSKETVGNKTVSKDILDIVISLISGNDQEQLPCAEDMLIILKHKDEFNSIVELLQHYNVSADKLEGEYVVENKCSERTKLLGLVSFDGKGGYDSSPNCYRMCSRLVVKS